MTNFPAEQYAPGLGQVRAAHVGVGPRGPGVGQPPFDEHGAQSQPSRAAELAVAAVADVGGLAGDDTERPGRSGDPA